MQPPRGMHNAGTTSFGGITMNHIRSMLLASALVVPLAGPGLNAATPEGVLV